MELSPKLVYCVIFIWFFTYVLIGSINLVTYSEMQNKLEGRYDSDVVTLDEVIAFTVDFEQYIAINFANCRRILNEGETYDSIGDLDREKWSKYMFQFVESENNYLLRNNDITVFEKYGYGMTWYDESNFLDKQSITIPYIGTWELEHPRWKIKNIEYPEYLARRGLEIEGSYNDGTYNLTEKEKGWTDLLWEWITAIPDGIGKIFDLLTFKITSIDGTEVMPIQARIILNLIFAPIHTIFILGIAPYVARMIEVIAKLIDIVVPF